MCFRQLRLNGIQTTGGREVKRFLDGIQETAWIGEPDGRASGRMRRMPRPNRKAERRLAILDAARHVAVREGAEGTTLRAVATAAGMEPSAVLYYFSGLNEIVRELVYAASDRFIETITRRSPRPRPRPVGWTRRSKRAARAASRATSRASSTSSGLRACATNP